MKKYRGYRSATKALINPYVKNQGKSNIGIPHRDQIILESNGSISVKTIYEIKKKPKSLFTDGNRYYRKAPDGNYWIAIKKPNNNPMTKCPICSVEIRRKNLKKHMSTVHGEPKQKNNSNNLPLLTSSDDIYSKCKVYSGGGFGVGKTKRKR